MEGQLICNAHHGVLQKNAARVCMSVWKLHVEDEIDIQHWITACASSTLSSYVQLKITINEFDHHIAKENLQLNQCSKSCNKKCPMLTGINSFLVSSVLHGTVKPKPFLSTTLTQMRYLTTDLWKQVFHTVQVNR